MYVSQNRAARSTALQRRGVGDYESTGNWSWEFYPPPYDFLAPRNSAPMPAPIIGAQGMGCAGGCGCGGHCSKGVGSLADAFDFSTWETTDYLLAAGGVYLLFSILGDFSRAKKKVSRYSRSRGAKTRRRRELQEELSGL